MALELTVCPPLHPPHAGAIPGGVRRVAVLAAAGIAAAFLSFPNEIIQVGRFLGVACEPAGHVGMRCSASVVAGCVPHL